MMMAGSRTSTRTAATMMSRRLTGIVGFFTDALEPCEASVPDVVMREA
jgi:hypothetical protein